MHRRISLFVFCKVFILKSDNEHVLLTISCVPFLNASVVFVSELLVLFFTMKKLIVNTCSFHGCIETNVFTILFDRFNEILNRTSNHKL